MKIVLLIVAFSVVTPVVFAAPTQLQSCGTPIAGWVEFNAGFRAGYKKANPLSICPIPPIPPIGRDTYEDGFIMGYNQGISDR